MSTDSTAPLPHPLEARLRALPEADEGPQRLGAAVGSDKVFAHRLLKAVRAEEPLAVLHEAPEPDPLRRFLDAALSRGAAPADVERARDLRATP